MSEVLERPKHELCVIDASGDIKTIWDADKPDEVESARKQFDDLRAKGYTIYHSKDNGKTGDVMHKFDPNAERLIAVKKVVGG